VATPPPAKPADHTDRKLAGIEVPVDVDDSWVDDYREYKRIIASYEPARQEIARLREAIALLETEQEDNKLLLDLHVEQLEAAGVILKWEYPQEDLVKISTQAEMARIDEGRSMQKFRDQLLGWLPGSPRVLTFKSIFEGLGVKDNPTRRIFIKNILAGLDYKTVAAVAAAGAAAEFHKPNQPL
jgi:hypothetical protein